MSPSITVVIPTFNRAHMITNAIKSLQDQKLRDWELIVIDDASTDNTQDVVNSHRRNDYRIRYIKQGQNRGGNAARNLGIKESKSGYISFLDDDDTIAPDKLSLQYEFLSKNSDIGLVYSGYYYVDADSQEIVKRIQASHRGNVLGAILKKNILGSPTPLIRRNCFKVAGLFDESLKSSQDWDMWIRIAQFYALDYIDAYLANVHIHGRQISVNLESKIKSRIKIFKKYNHLFDRKTRALHLKRIGVLHALNGSTKNASLSLVKSIRENPIDHLTLIHLILSVFPSLHRSTIHRMGLLKYGDVKFYV